MSAGHNEPRLLYSVGNISAFHIQDGRETPLSQSGPQTLSLLMVPTSSPFADLSSANPSSAAPEEDFYLHLHLPPELDLSLPATTQIYHKPPRSYLIPRWDLGPESGAFTRIEFPKIGAGPDRVTQEDIDTFETILAQCTAFLERASYPTGSSEKKYNPADFAPGEGYVGSGHGNGHGHIVLVDEEDGSVVGELAEGFSVVEGNDVHPGSKRPVEITLPQEGEGNQINVTNASEEYLKMAKHPAYKDSTLVQNAAVASRLIVTGSGWLANQMTSGADNFTKKTKPNPKPMTFTPTTQARVRKLNGLTQGAVGLSAKTVGQVTKHAQNLGATLSRRGDQQKSMKRDREGYKPGLLNKSMMAFSTIADGVDYASRNLLASGSSAATQVVGHRYGEDAKNVAGGLVGGVKNVGLVYVDAAGVSRRAVIKSVAKGMVVGKAPGGGDLVVGSGDGGAVPPEVMPSEKSGMVGNQGLASIGSGQAGSGQQVGFANSAPAPKSSGLGEPLGS
ncbi:spartin, partial [Lecanoromycetidae sp. Uapishka_2]